MVRFYVRQITEGKMKAEEVPEKWRKLVEAEINKNKE